MKAFIALAITGTLLAAPAAHAGDAAVEAVIHTMVDGFNTGDVKAVKAVHVASPAITDELAPFAWTGPKAFETWLADLTRTEAAEGKTGGKVWIGEPIRETVTGDHAYLIAPTTYTFQQKGQTLRETGTFTFALVKEKGSWKIQAWTWTSPEAQPVQ